MQENQELKKVNEENKCSLGLLRELEGRVVSEYQKNQWSNIILEEIRKGNFDFEDFFKQTQSYREIVLGERFVRAHSSEEASSLASLRRP
jgi:hypothetical protein